MVHDGSPSAFAPFLDELARLSPPAGAVLDAHVHLGADEDGMSLTPDALLGALDEVGPGARAVAFPFHDPERVPGYRVPNDRVLAWAREAGGRIVPYCRLDPADGPIPEAQRCLAAGARGIKLHPRAQSFGFDTAVAGEIFAVARDAGVPVLVHAGRGMPRMDALADLALRFPDVTLVLAHTALADQGMFATRLAGHPRVLYDTACLSPYDVMELFARVPAERVVFASDVPYGRPTVGLYQTLRVAALAGLSMEERALVTGGTMAAALDGRQLPAPQAPRLARIRPVDGTLARVASYLMMGIAAGLIGGMNGDVTLALPRLALARSVCRDPDPGPAGPALERIDGVLSAAEALLSAPEPRRLEALWLIAGAVALAATEPVAG